MRGAEGVWEWQRESAARFQRASDVLDVPVFPRISSQSSDGLAGSGEGPGMWLDEWRTSRKARERSQERGWGGERSAGAWDPQCWPQTLPVEREQMANTGRGFGPVTEVGSCT